MFLLQTKETHWSERRRPSTPGLSGLLFLFSTRWRSFEGALCVCQPRGPVCEGGEQRVPYAACLECVGVRGLACLGWKSGTGTTNSSALSFTPWGAATVTPRLRRQTAKLSSLLRSAARNCKFEFFYTFFFYFFWGGLIALSVASNLQGKVSKLILKKEEDEVKQFYGWIHMVYRRMFSG